MLSRTSLFYNQVIIWDGYIVNSKLTSDSKRTHRANIFKYPSECTFIDRATRPNLVRPTHWPAIDKIGNCYSVAGRVNWRYF